jgi:hypothetical protein
MTGAKGDATSVVAGVSVALAVLGFALFGLGGTTGTVTVSKSIRFCPHWSIFPCPDPVLGKGVLVQMTLQVKSILGLAARNMHQAGPCDMEPSQFQEYVLSKMQRIRPIV